MWKGRWSVPWVACEATDPRPGPNPQAPGTRQQKRPGTWLLQRFATGELFVEGVPGGGEHVVGDVVQVAAGFFETAGIDLNPGKMNVNALPLDVIAREVQGDLPGFER